MGLGVEVGVLAGLVANDPDGSVWLSEGLSAASALVVADGGGAHVEPVELPLLVSRAPVASYPYGFLHHLRRAYAYAVSQPGWVFEPLVAGEDPALDPVVEEETFMMSSHLLCHSDSEGFFLPVDFVMFVSGDVPGGMVGSTYRLRDELAAVAPVLGITMAGALGDDEVDRLRGLIAAEQGPWIEQLVWLSHWEAARLSIEHQTAMVYT